MKRLTGFSTALVLLVVAPTAMAFFGGDDEPMYVEADRVDIDDARGESRYKGSVEVNQGSIYIGGDSMITYQNDKGDVDKVVTTGNQAVFTQKAGKGTKAMNAKADKIEFYLDNDLVLLLGNAQIKQSSTEFYGNRIEYNMNTQAVHADKGKSGKRVRMVMQPKKKAPK